MEIRTNFDLNTWIISDTHFGHYNMVKLCNRPLNHSEKIATKWDKLVKPEDTVLHLGDLALWFGPSANMWHKFAGERPGNKYLIRGNHDIKDSYYYDWLYGYKMIDPFVQDFDGVLIAFSHEPLPWSLSSNWDLNIHGHLHNMETHNFEYDFDVNDSRYVNMSIELQDYKPKRLREILNL